MAFRAWSSFGRCLAVRRRWDGKKSGEVSKSGRNERSRLRMIKVKSRGNETVEQMLKRFKKLCEKEGLQKELKRVAYYEKPSEKRRRRGRKPLLLKPMR
jgi:small subunit ribosomal protein S21